MGAGRTKGKEKADQKENNVWRRRSKYPGRGRKLEGKGSNLARRGRKFSFLLA